jgi:hypothetical protein
MTQAEVAQRALQAIGIAPAGDSPSAEDSNRASEVVAAVYAMLRKERLINFAISAVPEWAQQALIHLTGLELCAEFGIGGERLQNVSLLAQKGRSDLSIQMMAMRQPAPTKVDYF